MSIITILFGFILIVLMLVALWYYLKSVVVMAKRHVLLGVAALFFAPIAQLVYYLAEKANITMADKKILLRSVGIWIIITLMGVLAAIILPTLQQTAL